jgi:hypothetical protein
VEIPACIGRAIQDAVAHHLETELGNRGLLLAQDAFTAAEAATLQSGARLLVDAIDVCYPASRGGGRDVLELEIDGNAARLCEALAFGAVTARVLAPSRGDSEQSPGSIALLCAMFNLGIGMVDGLCDRDEEIGLALLELVEGRDLAKAAEGAPMRGWLRTGLPFVLAEDPTAAFTVDIIEAFFETLHVAYPGAAWLQLRRHVAAQLGEALEAERLSVDRWAHRTPREQLIDCSRRTSVLPFQIIETLARGNQAYGEPSAGTELGEAVWRIDDLVDLCDDARSGALNSLLLAVAAGDGRPRGRDPLASLERLRASRDIASVAGQAAVSLLDGLRRATGHHGVPADHQRSAQLLYFIQRYAGIGPRATS